MWIEGVLWLGVPLAALVLAVWFRLPPGPAMALLTGLVIGGVGMWGITHAADGLDRIDSGLHDTYYIMEQNRSVLKAGVLMILVALPLALMARQLKRPAWLGAALFMLLHIGAALNFVPLMMMPESMPRRYLDHDAFSTVNHLSWAGTAMSFAALSGIAAASLVALYRMGWAHRTR